MATDWSENRPIGRLPRLEPPLQPGRIGGSFGEGEMRAHAPAPLARPVRNARARVHTRAKRERERREKEGRERGESIGSPRAAQSSSAPERMAALLFDWRRHGGNEETRKGGTNSNSCALFSPLIGRRARSRGQVREREISCASLLSCYLYASVSFLCVPLHLCAWQRVPPPHTHTQPQCVAACWRSMAKWIGAPVCVRATGARAHVWLMCGCVCVCARACAFAHISPGELVVGTEQKDTGEVEEEEGEGGKKKQGSAHFSCIHLNIYMYILLKRGDVAPPPPPPIRVPGVSLRTAPRWSRGWWTGRA